MLDMKNVDRAAAPSRVQRLRARVSALFFHSRTLGLLLFILGAALLAPRISSLSSQASASAPASNTIQVPARGNLQAALDKVEPGGTIVLEANATYAGNFVLPVKPGNDYVTIESSALASLPPEHARIGPGDSNFLPKIVSPNNLPALAAASGAHHYRFLGLEFRPAPNQSPDDLIRIGDGHDELSRVPHDFIFERDYIHGDPQEGAKRGITLNGRAIVVQDSYISDIKREGQDSQTLCGWSGPGPFTIENNYLEAAGENVMFGGALTPSPELLPSDIQIRHNYFFKPLSWKMGHPTQSGKHWSVKNILELKCGRRVRVEGNVFENCWADGQTGFAFVLKTAAYGASNPWLVTEDVTVINNIIRHAANGMNLCSTCEGPAGPARRMTFRDNVFEDIGGKEWSGDSSNGLLLQVLNGVQGLVFEHNTALNTGSIIMSEGAPNLEFVFRNNIVFNGRYGVVGTGTASGSGTLERYFPHAVFQKNVIVDGEGSQYPGGNFFPGKLEAVGFLGEGEDYPLDSASRFKNKGSDKKDPGADVTAVHRATAGATSGRTR
jgi:hypothetical protein